MNEDPDVLICIPITKPLAFADNLVGHCAACHKLVQFRPHAPKLIKRLCTDCARKSIMTDDEARFVVSPESWMELLAYKRRH